MSYTIDKSYIAEQSYEGEKYFTTLDNLKQTLDTYGVAIIPSILNETECDSMVSGIWDFFEYITQKWEIPINRSDEKTWTLFYKLYPVHSMLIQYWNVGHAQVSWDVRQNPKIVDVYAKLYKCSSEELLVSFDGLSFNLPPEITKRGWSSKLWLHCDQSFTQNELKTVQSWVTALDVNEGDATLVVLEQSHKYHKQFAEEFQMTKNKQWHKLTEEQQTFYKNKNCELKKIKCPKGSIVLWDSRTIHCGTEAEKTRQLPNMRAIVYVCYAPRSKCKENNIKKRQKAFNELRATIHDPINTKLFGKKPQTYGAKLPEYTVINKPNLTELGLKLAGF
jgi:ectoine hydroxylase-related dioxygenase (phytanoyl-CoA dioxygenase family)